MPGHNGCSSQQTTEKTKIVPLLMSTHGTRESVSKGHSPCVGANFHVEKREERVACELRQRKKLEKGSENDTF